MNTTQRAGLLQRWSVIQEELIPGLGQEVEGLTPKLVKLIHILEWARIEEFVPAWHGIGRPPKDRGALANGFVAKAVLGLTTTVALIDRLTVDRALRRICGFSRWTRLPDEATFSRAFAEFAQSRLAERVHQALVETHLGTELIGHISRDGTAIEARERPAKPAPAPVEATPALQAVLPGTTPAEPATPAEPKKRGRPRLDETRVPKLTRIQQQRSQTLAQMQDDLPRACDRGTKCNAQGYKVSWNGYKLHIDTADCGVPIAAILSSASMHDSQAAIPLSHLTAARVTNLYDVMDAAYCSAELREHCKDLGHVPLIDHNPRGGKKLEFDPAEAVRYNERTVAERMNARLKDEFGGNPVWVKGNTKVMSHLMFGLLVLTVDQLMRLLQ
ncbi:MAG: IS5/IS1182 family transposase [Gallionella sp.]|nr:MAG: IS5/IS1182 family transposase [Gallionella sp.]